MAIHTNNPGFEHQGVGRLFSHGLPKPYPLSAVWWIYVEDRQAGGYFTAFAYGPSTFSGTDYYTAAGVLGKWSCGVAGTDSTTGVQIAENRWWRQGFRTRIIGTTREHRFFYDLPATVSRSNNFAGAYFAAPSSTHFLRFADVEWSPSETLIGRIGGIKIWQAYLPAMVLAHEAMSHDIVHPEYRPYLWAHIRARHVGDLHDWSGNGRRFYIPATSPTTIADPPLLRPARRQIERVDIATHHALLASAFAAAGGTTYNDSITESATPADSFSVALTANPALTETATPAESQAAAATFVATIGESAAAGESMSGGLLLTESITESATAADSNAAAATFAPTLSESVTAVDDQGVAATINPSLIETVTAGESNAAAATFNATLTESAAPADDYPDTHQTGNTYNDTLTETLSAADSYAVTLVANADVAESLFGADDYAADGGIVVASGGSGGSNRKRKKRQTRIVEIDGKRFVGTDEQIEAFIARAERAKVAPAESEPRASELSAVREAVAAVVEQQDQEGEREERILEAQRALLDAGLSWLPVYQDIIEQELARIESENEERRIREDDEEVIALFAGLL